MYAVLLLLILIPGLPRLEAGQNPEQEMSKADKRRRDEADQKRLGENAIEEARRQVSLNPDSAEAHFTLAETLIYGPIRAEDHDKIMEEYLSAIRLKPDYAEAYFRLGVFYANKNEYEKGYEALNKRFL